MEKFGSEIAAPSDLQPASINWSDLASKAVAIDVMPDDPKPAPAPAPPGDVTLPTIAEVAAKAEAKTQEPTPQVESREPDTTPQTDKSVRKFQDDDLVEVKVDGEIQVVTYKDYKDGIQREAHYTKRMQQLAQQRQAAEQELASQYANLYQEAQRLEAERQRIEQNHPLAKLAKQLEAQEKVEADPNTLATLGEIRKALDTHKQEVEQTLQQRDAEAQARLAHAALNLRQQQAIAQDAARFTAALTETLSAKDLAVVKTVVPSPELADAIIRYNVAQMEPRTIEEGIDMMRTFVKQWADSVRGQQKVSDARTEAAKARAVIEPPQGSPPAPAPTSKPQDFFKKDGGLDWQALHRKALAVMEG
jgi:hypothetical protein